MFKAYVGNLSPSVTEERLDGVFRENGISVDSIILKKKYAFIDFPDQVNADRAIDVLNGMQLDGMTLQVEPPLSKRGKTNKIVLRNMPVHVPSEEVEMLVRSCGMVTKCDHVGAEGVVYVTYENPDQAQQAVQQLNGQTWNNVTLQVDYASSRMPRRNRSYEQSSPKPVDIPIRILLRSDYIGAIIGRDGKTIQQITADSGARVDVHRKEHAGTQDTAITIKGAPQAITNAIKSIMEIAKREAENGNRGDRDRDIPLKILCPNYLCGRIIGRQGRVINGMMESTEAHIVVSNSSPDPNNYYVERVVTLSGDVDNISRAESMVSERMRKAYEKDSEKAQSMGMMMPPAMHPCSMNPVYPGNMAQGGYPPYMQAGPGSNWGYNNQCMPPAMPMNYPEPVEVSYIYYPEQAVGAMIGTGGTNIKSMMDNSTAKMKVLPEEESHAQKSSGGNGDKKEDNRFSTVGLRKMSIVGSHEAQWKAQFFVFKKLRDENFIHHDDSLFSEVIIPSAVAGRVIGKGGQHFKEMQRVCGGLVRVLDPISDTEVPVQILGHFYATQSIQRRIRDLVNSTQGQAPSPHSMGNGIMGNGIAGGPGMMNGSGAAGPYRERRPRREQAR